MSLSWVCESSLSSDGRWWVHKNNDGTFVLTDRVLEVHTYHKTEEEARHAAEVIDSHPEMRKPHFERVAGYSETEPPGTGGYDEGDYCP